MASSAGGRTAACRTLSSAFFRRQRDRCVGQLAAAGSLRQPPDEGAVPINFAVLVPLIIAGGEPSVLFTKRSMLIPSHRGQVSFPGGRIEPGESVQAAALRESWEELRLSADDVDVWGCMKPSLTYRLDESVAPVLGLVTRSWDELRLQPCNNEVAAVFVRTLAALTDPASMGHTQFRFGGGGKRPANADAFYSLPVFLKRDGDYRIWGLTAIILHQVMRLLLPDSYKSTVKVVMYRGGKD